MPTGIRYTCLLTVEESILRLGGLNGMVSCEGDSIKHPDEEMPIFIVGMDRSGTTLMSALLDAHPHIAIAPETWFLEPWAVQFGRHDLNDTEQFERFWSDYTSHPYFSHLGLDAETLRDEILSQQPRTLASIFRALLKAYAAR